MFCYDITVFMKNKNDKTQHKPFHLHLEYFFRKQYCLVAVMALLLIALLKADSQTITIMREAYAQGFGIIGQYMREETSRMSESISIVQRTPTISGQ
jgi:hypothetical protein